MSHIINTSTDLKNISQHLDLIRTKGYSKDTVMQILFKLIPFSKEYVVTPEVTTDGYPAFFNAYKRIIHISEEPLKKYIDNLIDAIIELYPNISNQKEELRAYMTYFVLCHEIEHTYQYMFGERYIEPQYRVVGDAYKKIIEIKEEKMSLLKFRILLSRYKSQKDKAHFVLERNANVEAYDLLLKLSLYESNIDINKLMYNQWMGYSVCGYASLRYNGSFEEAFKATWRKNKFEELVFDKDIPLEDRIRYGLPIDDSDRIVLLKKFVETKQKNDN